jgi:hypothetical protein
MFRMLGNFEPAAFANTCSTEVPSSLTLPAATDPEDPRQRLMGSKADATIYHAGELY